MFSILTSKIFGGLSIGLLIALAVMGLKLHWTQAKLDSVVAWQEQVTGATRTAAHHPNLGKAGVAQQILYMGRAIDDVRLKMVEAKAKALADKAATEQRNDERKRNSDHALQAQAVVDRRRTDDYKRDHRVRVAQGAPAPDSGVDGGHDLPGPAFASGVDNGPGPVAELVDPVTISSTDFDRCTVNSRRVENAHDWASNK